MVDETSQQLCGQPNAEEANDRQRTRIRDLAQAVLDARAKFPEATMADLYDPDAMKAELRHVHRAPSKPPLTNSTAPTPSPATASASNTSSPATKSWSPR
jgi:hypothetical protein